MKRECIKCGNEFEKTPGTREIVCPSCWKQGKLNGAETRKKLNSIKKLKKLSL